MCVDIPPAALSQSRHTSRGMHAHEMMPVLQRLLHNVCTHACVYGREGAEAAPVAELLQRRPDPVLFTTKTKDVKGVTIDASSAASFANDSTPALPHRVHLACEASHNRIPNTTDTHIRCVCKHKHTHTHGHSVHPCPPLPWRISALHREGTQGTS